MTHGRFGAPMFKNTIPEDIIEAKVLIVSRTIMKSGYCIGGFDIKNKQDVRLLTQQGENQDSACEYHIGDLWDVVYTPIESTPPHTEDVIVRSSKLFKRQGRGLTKSLINGSCRIIKSPIQELFEQALNFSERAPFIEKKDTPNHSVCFWIPDHPLLLEPNGERYSYKGSESASIKYVGSDTAINEIHEGSIVRLSLARWWRRNPHEGERCYLQISGWFI